MVGSAGPSGSSVTARLADSSSYQRCGIEPRHRKKNPALVHAAHYALRLLALIYWLTTPSGAVSILKAAEISALV